MYEICLHVNFMFQFEIKIDYPFTFQKFFFSKYPVFGYLPKSRVNTQKIFTYPLGIYSPHITIHGYDSRTCTNDILIYFLHQNGGCQITISLLDR